MTKRDNNSGYANIKGIAGQGRPKKKIIASQDWNSENSEVASYCITCYVFIEVYLVFCKNRFCFLFFFVILGLFYCFE